LWVKSRQGGLSKMDLQTKSISRYVPEKGNSQSIGHNWVRSVYEEKKGILWVGLGNGGAHGGALGDGGVDRMDIEKGTFTHFKLIRSDDGLDDFSHTVYGICEDNEGYLWLSTGPGGIFRSDKDKNEILPFSLSGTDRLKGDVLLNLVIHDSNGDIWASDFMGQGTLYLFDRKADKFYSYLKGFKATNVIIDDQGWLLISSWDKIKSSERARPSK